jgi:hypothetical protein
MINEKVICMGQKCGIMEEEFCSESNPHRIAFIRTDTNGSVEFRVYDPEYSMSYLPNWFKWNSARYSVVDPDDSVDVRNVPGLPKHDDVRDFFK